MCHSPFFFTVRDLSVKDFLHAEFGVFILSVGAFCERPRANTVRPYREKCILFSINIASTMLMLYKKLPIGYVAQTLWIFSVGAFIERPRSTTGRPYNENYLSFYKHHIRNAYGTHGLDFASTSPFIQEARKTRRTAESKAQASYLRQAAFEEQRRIAPLIG